MRCRVGDLAVIAPDLPWDNWARGYIVRCIELGMPDDFGGPAWFVEPEIRDPSGRIVDAVSDSILRPIRPGDVTDEEVRDLYAPKLPEVA